jgi:aspartyl protease family protein
MGNPVSHFRSVAVVFLLAAPLAYSADVNVVGLFAGKAVLMIDGGKPRTLSVGQVTPEGVRLISATSESAVVEVGGRRQTLAPGQSTHIGSGASGSGQSQAKLTADSGGHFFTAATVNGISLKFLVDTGASLITLSSSDAKSAGVNYLSGQKAALMTANGLIPAYRVKLDTVRLGDITLNNVDGIVVEGNSLGGFGLLGMSFLNRVEMRREGDQMTLIRRF